MKSIRSLALINGIGATCFSNKITEEMELHMHMPSYLYAQFQQTLGVTDDVSECIKNFLESFQLYYTGNAGIFRENDWLVFSELFVGDSSDSAVAGIVALPEVCNMPFPLSRIVQAARNAYGNIKPIVDNNVRNINSLHPNDIRTLEQEYSNLYTLLKSYEHLFGKYDMEADCRGRDMPTLGDTYFYPSVAPFLSSNSVETLNSNLISFVTKKYECFLESNNIGVTSEKGKGLKNAVENFKNNLKYRFKPGQFDKYLNSSTSAITNNKPTKAILVPAVSADCKRDIFALAIGLMLLSRKLLGRRHRRSLSNKSLTAYERGLIDIWKRISNNQVLCMIKKRSPSYFYKITRESLSIRESIEGKICLPEFKVANPIINPAFPLIKIDCRKSFLSWKEAA